MLFILFSCKIQKLLHLTLAKTFLIVYGISMVKYFSVFSNILKCLYVQHRDDMLIWSCQFCVMHSSNQVLKVDKKKYRVIFQHLETTIHIQSHIYITCV